MSLRFFSQGAVNGHLPRRLPRIDAPLRGDDVLDAGAGGGLAAIGVGRKQPGVNNVGPQIANVPPQPPVAGWVELPALPMIVTEHYAP